MDVASVMSRARSAAAGKTQDLKPANADLLPRRDYLKVVWPEVPDPFLVCLDRKKLGLLKKQFPGLVIYFPEELKELEKSAHDREAIMTTHLIKKEFLHSWVIPDTPVENRA